MEILLNAANSIATTNFNVTSKTIAISGVNNYPLDRSSLKEIYDVTAGGSVGLPNFDQFAWFRSNGLPIFVWGISPPVGAANGDTLQIMVDIPLTQSQLSLQQKQASASAGTVGTYVGSETPTGAINGTNTTYTLAFTPIKGAVALVYVPGAQQPAQLLQVGVDFTSTGNTVVLNTPPITGSNLYAVYYH